MDPAPGTVALLDAIVAHAPVGLGLWDQELRLRHANAALARLTHTLGADATGTTAPELLGGLGEELERLLAGVLATEAPVVARSVRGTTPFSGGEELEWIGAYYPVFREDGALLGVAGLLREASSRRPAADLQRALQEALIARTEAMDIWRTFPGSDPDLPQELLPRTWVRADAHAIFTEIYDGLGPLGETRFRQILGEHAPELVPLVRHHTSRQTPDDVW
jgi:hypothetical protein